MKISRYIIFLIFILCPQSIVAIDVEKLGDDYTTKIMRDGQSLYFSLVKITADNFDYWRQYAKAARSIAKMLRNVNEAAQMKDAEKQVENFTYLFGGDENKTKAFIRRVSTYQAAWQRDYFHKRSQMTVDEEENYKAKQAGAIYGSPLTHGIGGMDYALTVSEGFKQVYIAFISTKPFVEIKQIAHPSLYKDRGNKVEIHEDYKGRFDFMVMSVMVIHNPEAPLSTHFGIFRNPLSFHRHFRGEELHTKGISMALHGFAGFVERDHFGGDKKYMVTWPMKSMADIFLKKVDNKYLHLGTNLDYNLSSDHMLPLIFEIGDYEDVMIVREDVDIRGKLEISGDDIFFASPRRFDFSYVTSPNLRTLVNLEGLIPHFLAIKA